MRIAFVEVRDKTALLSAVASRLTNHRISWLVQNHSFGDTSMANATYLPYPSRREVRILPTIEDRVSRDHIDLVVECDRFSNTFGISMSHYEWYYQAIRGWFERDAPELVIGEVGNFHSHMVSLIAAECGVPFLNPTSSRYPTGRFAFFVGDRLRTLGGDLQPVSDEDIERTVEEIRTGRRKPDYMTIAPRRRRDDLGYRGQIFKEWLRGERYATQPPSYFLRQAMGRFVKQRRWDALSTGIDSIPGPSDRPVVLYPLQMQPELNLDIWGREYRDQVAVVNELSASPVHLLVKPNPKSFHELSSEMIVATGKANVTAIAHGVPMDRAESVADLVVTTSGTVAIERLVRGRPVGILLDDYARWLGVPSMGELGLHLSALGWDAVNTVRSSQQAIDPSQILKRIVASSYPGVISEPRFAPHVLRPENLALIARAVEDVVGLVEGSR